MPDSVQVIRRALLDENVPDSYTVDVRWFRKTFDYYRKELPAGGGAVEVKLERDRVEKLAGILGEYAKVGNITSNALRGQAVALSDALKRHHDKSADGKTLTLYADAVKTDRPLDLEAIAVALVAVIAMSVNSGGVAEETKGIDLGMAAGIAGRIRSVKIALRKGKTPTFDLDAEERRIVRAAVRWLLSIREQEWPERAKKANISVVRYHFLLLELGKKGDDRRAG